MKKVQRCFVSGRLDRLDDLRFVVVSVTIAVLASYSALDLARRIASSYVRVRVIWPSGAGLAMGIGTGAMHYDGMFAFRLPVPLENDWPTVLLSLLAAVTKISYPSRSPKTRPARHFLQPSQI
jgi:NO-binding membrane sensor protein with MHYT domain